MCGPTSAQTQLQQEQADFYQEAQQQQQQVYGEDQQILKTMTGIYEPILAAGPSQTGFSQQEETALNTQATEGVSTNYAQAAKASAENEASLGGGNTYLPSGVAEQTQAEIAAAAAGQRSTEQAQITEANYAQGYNEWQNAAEGLATVGGELSPVGYSGAATGAGNAASTTANEIAQEDNSWVNAAIGAGTSIAGGVIGENPGGIFGG
jgi:hypothetical protein